MIGSDKKIVPVTLPRVDIECIEKLGKPISEFCRDAVHERLRIIEIAKENRIEERFFEDAKEDIPTEDEPPRTERKIVIKEDPIMEPTKNWSKLFAEV